LPTGQGSNPFGRAVRSFRGEKILLVVLTVRLGPLGHEPGFG